MSNLIRWPRQARGTSILATLVFLAACGGGSEGTTNPPADVPVPTSVAVVAGASQTARTGAIVATAPAVLVKDQNDAPMSGATVTFAVSAGGGTVTGASVTTNGSGVATVGSWTLGAAAGANALTATVTGGSSPSAQIPATARLPRWTMLVYLAADNPQSNLGIEDIDAMESAGADPEVQVVLQAEFSPSQLSVHGCNAACFNRPNFNTFRYVANGQGTPAAGPDGPVTDIGNRNMADPAQLKEFVTWARQTAPAEHYALVLWNHGGGYVDLIQDVTSNGGASMSIADLPTALTGLPLDVVDFDMSLMGSYETLAKMNGLAGNVVFSEGERPGVGNPYREILDDLQVNPAVDGRTFAGIIVDQYDASHQNFRSSTTASAYDLTGLAGFEGALNALAASLRTSLPTFGPVIDAAAAASQRFETSQLKDVVDFADSLAVRTTDATLLGQIAAVKAQATGSFRIRNRARTGTALGTIDVSRASGLNILLPSAADNDQMPDAGPSGFSTYETHHAGRPWTQFLSTYLANRPRIAYTDQGTDRFETYLVWDTASVSRGVDVDLWVVEPNGTLYVPYLGSVTPNGSLTNDSQADSTYVEGYLTRRFVQNGMYKFYVHLWADPQDHRPFYDMVYRQNPADPFGSLYGASPHRLSTEISWLDDLTPTFPEIEAGAYTDLQFAAFWNVGVTPDRASRLAVPTQGGTVSANRHEITSAQLATVRSKLAARRKPALGISPRTSRLRYAFPPMKQ